MTSFQNTVLEYIKAHSLISSGGVLVALSGGADSVALLEVLCALHANGDIKAAIYACHINHNLRGEESNGDEQFVKDFCNAKNVPCKCISVNVLETAEQENLSIESAARQLRRSRLYQTACEFGCDCIATAHHRNDNAETIIHRLARGTGIKGLCGIWPLRTFQTAQGNIRYIRPLLSVTREQIEQYCISGGIEWRTDSTNAQLIYTRNIIRHKILPQLQKDCRKDITELLCTLSQTCRRLYEKIEKSAAELWLEAVCISEDDAVVMDAPVFNAAPQPLRQELIRMAYNRLGGSELKITQQHYESLITFAEQTDSAKFLLPSEIYCFRGYGRLIFQKLPTGGIAFTNITAQGEYTFGGNEITVTKSPFDAALFKDFIKHKSVFEEWFDADKLKLPIRARRRETGDKFSPIGQRSPMKMGKFLIGAKINHKQRCEMTIFEDAAKNIIWIAPHRASDITKITESTKEVYKITIRPQESV